MRQYCAICNERIEDPRCYVLDPDYPKETCICTDCMKHQLRILKDSGMDKFLADFISDQILYEMGTQVVPGSTDYYTQEEATWN